MTSGAGRLGVVDAVVLLAAVTLLGTRLGGLDLWAPDEPRYGAVAESVRGGDVVLLKLNGEAYTQKPPLYFWLAALAGAPGGRATEWAARVPSALAGVGLVAATLVWGRRWLGIHRGVIAGAILLTTWQIAYLGRRAQLDVLLTLFTTLALFAFWRLDRQDRPTRRGVLAMHAAMGLAVLTKGPVGFLVPVVAMAAFLTWERRLSTLRRLMPPLGLLLSLGPGLAWLAVATALAPEGYFDRAVVENLFGRFFAGTSHARPFYYYLYQLPIQFLPWTPLWGWVGWMIWRGHRLDGAERERDRVWRFLLAWFAAVVVFFSLSSGKRALYLLPVFPALALLCADALVFAGVLRRWLRGDPARPVSLAFAGLAAAIGAAALASPFVGATRNIDIPWGLALASAAVPAFAALAWRMARRSSAPGVHRLVILFEFVWLAELLCFTGYFEALEPEKSPRPIAQAARDLTAPDEPIGLVAKRALVGGLNYYGERTVREIRSPADVGAFFDEGGRVVVIPERYLERIPDAHPVEIRARARSGRRALVVITPQPGSSDRSGTGRSSDPARPGTSTARRRAHSWESEN